MPSRYVAMSGLKILHYIIAIAIKSIFTFNVSLFCVRVFVHSSLSLLGGGLSPPPVEASRGVVCSM